MTLMKKELGDQALPKNMENPFQASFRFTLDPTMVDTTHARALNDELSKFNGVSAFYYPEDLLGGGAGGVEQLTLNTLKEGTEK